MPSLSDYTNYTDNQAVEPAIDPNITRIVVRPQQKEPDVKEPEDSTVKHIFDKLFGLNGEERYQLWPEKVVREGLSAAHDTITGDIPQYSIDENTGDVHTSPQMIKAGVDMSSLVGTGGLAGVGNEAGTALGVVPVDIAKKLNFKTGLSNDILTQAVKNTPNSSIDADGHLILNITRNQLPDQEMAESVRGGVFYLPEGSRYGKYYNGTTNNNYGGAQTIQGQTAFKNPLVVKGQTGGKAPETAYNQLMGDKTAINNLSNDVNEVVSASNWMRKKDPQAFYDLLNRYLDKHAPDMRDYADYILDNSSKGNQLKYALQEAAIANKAREMGHDGIIGYSKKKTGEPFLSEVFDTRENRYPSPSGDFSVHPELYSDTTKPAAAINSLKNKAFLRPALKYGEKLYKGKEGAQHVDLIPEDLYPTFQKQAMNGEDISHWNFGFHNDKGHFLDREKALQYGIDNGIIDPQAGKFGALTSTMMADSSKPGVAIEASMQQPQTIEKDGKSYKLTPVTHNPFKDIDNE